LVDEFLPMVCASDAVASMLVLDYGRREGEWIPNRHGARKSRRHLVSATLERSRFTAIIRTRRRWPKNPRHAMVSRPTSVGGWLWHLK